MSAPEFPSEISTAELAEWRNQDLDVQVLDVREPWEHDICAIPGDVHIPMQQIPARADQLDRDRPVAVLCHHGGRSAQVARWLSSQGFSRVSNVAGGIDSWAREVDTSMATY